MDNEAESGSGEIGGASMISDVPDQSDSVEVSESPRLSPLTNRLTYGLTLNGDSKMGVEDNWANEESSSAADYPNNVFNFSEQDPSTASTLALGEQGPMMGPFLPTNSSLNNFYGDNSETHENAEVNAPAGVCGLKNLGNTCFMAAGLQCLTATSPVMRHFLDSEQEEASISPNSLISQFSTLLGKMWSGKYKVLPPSEFKLSLGLYHSQFEDNRQHDCQEFLALLLDSLHEQMNIAKSSDKCHLPVRKPTTATSKSDSSITKELNTTFTASNDIENFNAFENDAPDDFDSPNCTMPGTPKDEAMDDFNTFEKDEQLLPSESDTRSIFIHNDTNMLSKEGYDYLKQFSKDMVKDAKTSNANFMVDEPECNNDIHYDSQKFPRENTKRLTIENSNLTENHDFDNKSASVKRIKEVNVQKNNTSIDCITNGFDGEYDSDLEKCNVKRMRLEDKEKCINQDGLDSNSNQCSRNSQNGENGAMEQDEIEANKHWAKHLEFNRSIIVDTFQGQFKSKVVCASCGHVSVTYEPFMYLSVPLPNATERYLSVTYIPANGEAPIRCGITVNKQSKISKVKEELLKTLARDVPTENTTLTLFVEDHISRIIEDALLLKCIDTTHRQLYAFETLDPPEPYKEDDKKEESQIEPTSTIVKTETSTEEACTICLEDCDREFLRHIEPSCNYPMCNSCIESYFKNQTKKCPMCKKPASPASFVRITAPERPVHTMRIFNIPLILRHDTDEATNNRKSTSLFGHPRLLKLPSLIDAKVLWETVKKIVPQDESYTLHLVNAQGVKCSRCLLNAHCTGCKVPENGPVILKCSDTLAVRYTGNIPHDQETIDHPSYKKENPVKPLSLYDCLQAFSQSENLDENNPWFCPKCDQNRCATKTLTVHRYPKYLIVYLKRFIFYDNTSMKLDDRVDFPLNGLHCGDHLYDLYACVCHFGGLSVGHYTAYAKNPETGVWHYYNDESTVRQKPREEEFSNAYILFYSRQGTTNAKQCNR